MAKVLTTNPAAGAAPSAVRVLPSASVTSWRDALPMLSGATVILREPVRHDALGLLTALSPDALAAAMPDAPPSSQLGIESLIASLQAKRAQGQEACWVVLPRDTAAPVGIIRVRALDHGFSTVEGTAAIAAEFRGTHVFQDAARLVLGCLFRTMQVHRAEFRIDVSNARANGALRKLGATQEGLLRRALRRDGLFVDQVLWAIVAGDWCGPRDSSHPSIH